MPKYFFNIEAHRREEDDEGVDLADAGEARVEAIVLAGASLRDDPELIEDGREFKVEVKDESGAVIVDIVVRAIDGPGA